MNGSSTILEYEMPAPISARHHLAALVIAVIATGYAVFAVDFLFDRAREHAGSMFGCATGRLHVGELICLGTLPAVSAILVFVEKVIGVHPAVVVVRVTAYAVMAAYAGLWLFLIGIFHAIFV